MEAKLKEINLYQFVIDLLAYPEVPSDLEAMQYIRKTSDIKAEIVKSKHGKLGSWFEG